jgi:YbbR domain-containing protein
MRRKPMNRKRLFDKITENWSVKVLSLIAAVLLVFFYRLSNQGQKYLSLGVEVISHDEYVVVAMGDTDITVQVKGDKEKIDAVVPKDIVLTVDLKEITKPGKHMISVRPRLSGTAANLDPLQITIEPSKIEVTVEKKITKVVQVSPALKGAPSFGYAVDRIYVSPENIEIEGPENSVNLVKVVHTGDINLTGKKDRFTQIVDLVSPGELIGFPKGAQVELTVIIVARDVDETKEDMPIEITGSENSLLDFSVKEKTGTIRLQGSGADLEALKASDLKLVVDVSKITKEGEYLLDLEALAPNHVLIMEFSPLQVTVVAQRRSQ